MPVALTTSEWIDLAVAFGTLTLAGATFWMARGTSKLAKTAERQRQATIAPVVRLVRGLRHDISAMRVAQSGDPGEFLLVPLENVGPTPVKIEEVELTPGGKGEVASQRDYLSPEVAPGERRDFHFRMASETLADLKSGRPVDLEVTYRSLLTGSQFYAVEHLMQNMDGMGNEQWIIAGSEIPRRLEWVEA